jgi:hypothetical protein
LTRTEVNAIVPPSKPTSEPDRLPLWVRGALLGIALGLTVVFAVAWRIKPYREDGSAEQMATHQQIGLLPCTFVEKTGVPCPACGMTTSFALLVRGDLINSLGANWVGTMLAAFCLAFIPWAVIGVVRGRTPFVRSLEKASIVVITGLLVLMLLRWGIVLAWLWYNGRIP